MFFVPSWPGVNFRKACENFQTGENLRVFTDLLSNSPKRSQAMKAHVLFLKHETLHYKNTRTGFIKFFYCFKIGITLQAWKMQFECLLKCF